MQLGVLCSLLKKKAFHGSRRDWGAIPEEAFEDLEAMALKYPGVEISVDDPVTVGSVVDKIARFGLKRETLDYFDYHKDVLLL